MSPRTENCKPFITGRWPDSGLSEMQEPREDLGYRDAAQRCAAGRGPPTASLQLEWGYWRIVAPLREARPSGLSGESSEDTDLNFVF